MHLIKCRIQTYEIQRFKTLAWLFDRMLAMIRHLIIFIIYEFDCNIFVMYFKYLFLSVCQFDMGSQYKKCGTADACIWKDFFHDDILNCPYTNCADENGCQVYYDCKFILLYLLFI